MPSRLIKVNVTLADQQIENRAFSKNTIEIGTLTNCDITLDRREARLIGNPAGGVCVRIRAGEDEVRLTDMGSLSIAILNGVQIHGDAVLRGSATLQIGSYRIEIGFDETNDPQSIESLTKLYGGRMAREIIASRAREALVRKWSIALVPIVLSVAIVTLYFPLFMAAGFAAGFATLGAGYMLWWKRCPHCGRLFSGELQGEESDESTTGQPVDGGGVVYVTSRNARYFFRCRKCRRAFERSR